MIDTAALDRAVNIVMPDVTFAMKNGSCRTHRFAIEAYYRSVVRDCHRQRAQETRKKDHHGKHE